MLTAPIGEQIKSSQPVEYHYLNLKRSNLLESAINAAVNQNIEEEMMTITAVAHADPRRVLMDIGRTLSSMAYLSKNEEKKKINGGLNENGI